MQNTLASSALFAIALIVSAAQAENKVVDDEGWSPASSGLSGRVRLVCTKITTVERLDLSIEIRNTGTQSLAVDVGNPFCVDVEVRDQSGQTVPTTMVRGDVLYCSQWAVIPRACYLGFPASQESSDGAKGSNLDVTTSIWKLPPGKYSLVAKFSSKIGTSSSSPSNAWQGALQLQSVAFEVAAPEATWHLAAECASATIQVEKALYEVAGDSQFYIHIRVSNKTERSLGLDLRSFWKVVYPNQWGMLDQRERGVIDERRLQRHPLSEKERAELIADFAAGKLVGIPARSFTDYYRRFNVEGSRDAAKKSLGKFLFISLDGEQVLTDGVAVEQVAFEGGLLKTNKKSDTDLFLNAPVVWKTIPAGARIIAGGQERR